MEVKYTESGNGRMEQILVAMDIRQAGAVHLAVNEREIINGFTGSVYRAIYLAERIRADVNILLILKQNFYTEREKDWEALFRKHLELIIEKARFNKVTIRYYMTAGNFEEEVIRFVQESKITLLVLGQPDKPDRAFKKSLSIIRHGVNCTIELVRQKKYE